MSRDSLITYSPAFTLVPTYECFNRCSYCNFRTDPGSDWITLASARRLLTPLQAQGIVEILILSGEVHPHSLRRSEWIRHLVQLCELALEMGFLPHTNAGPLDRAEMELLKSVNASMGLMLEQITPRLLETVHRHAPSKDPQLRLQQLAQAGELKIPFTTGILIGIGETGSERIQTLEAIRHLHQQYGHIQEVIIQPHRPALHADPLTWQLPAEDLDPVLVETVQLAAEILPSEITIQIPPNLTEATAACILAGARDLGGIGPKDHVNPDYPHPDPEQLQAWVAPLGFRLQPRLPVYPQYLSWLPERIRCQQSLQDGSCKPVN